MANHPKVLLAICITAFFIQPTIEAQDEYTTGNVFVISTYKIQFQDIDDVLTHWKEYQDQVIQQNEFVLSSRVFRHMYGPDWTLVMINEYDSWGDISQAYIRNQELEKKAFPDQKKRDEIQRMLRSMMHGHTDAIVMEDESLRK